MEKLYLLKKIIANKLEIIQQRIDMDVQSWDAYDFEFNHGRRFALEDIKDEIDKILDKEFTNC